MSISSQGKNYCAKLMWLVVAFFIAFGSGCEDPRQAETTAFEAAELEYRQGNYEEALDGYQAFLRRYPQSPLAATAEMRLRSIHREVSSVMDETRTPSPSYHGSAREQSQHQEVLQDPPPASPSED